MIRHRSERIHCRIRKGKDEGEMIYNRSERIQYKRMYKRG